MRLAVLADVHGNLPALEAVLDDACRQAVDGLIVAGDLIVGPYSVDVIRRLRSFSSSDGSWMVRGNNEDYLLALDAGDGPQAWRTSRQWALLRWTYRHVDRETLGFIASLPEQHVVALDGTAPIRVVHGSPRSPSEGLFPYRDLAVMDLFRRASLLRPGCDPAVLDRALELVEEPVLVCGHTHIAWRQEQDGRLALNPGAVGGPLNGDPRAQYALLDWHGGRWHVEHRAVAYDLDALRTACEESGLLAEGGAMARAYLLSSLTASNTMMDLLSHAYRLAAQAGIEDCDTVPDDIWDQATLTFDWGENDT